MSIARSFPASLRAAALLCCAALAACGPGGPSGGGGGGVQAQQVTTEVVGTRPWSDTIPALGTVKARESVTVTAKVSETVERVHFDSGDAVKAGAILVTLTGNQQQAAFQAAEATAKEAEQQYKRSLELVERQLVSRAMLDTQRATLDAASARVAQMRADIGDRTIRAPFSGVLGIRQISPGSLVTPGTTIATLDDISRVYVDFPVPEAFLAHLVPGRRLTGSSVAWPGQVFEGTVDTVDARVDQASRAVTVRGTFPNPDHRLRPGMLLQVELERPRREALLVPEIAVVQVGRDTFVWRVLADDTVERATISVGVRRNGLAEVVDGLAPGDRIVLDGTGKLRPGMKIADASSRVTEG